MSKMLKKVNERNKGTKWM